MSKYPNTWTTATIRIYEVEKIILAYNDAIDRQDRIKLVEVREEADEVLKHWGPQLHPDEDK